MVDLTIGGLASGEWARRFRGGQTRWDETCRFGDRLFIRLSGDRVHYGDSGVVLEVFLEVFEAI